jgi:hypothetical protein
MPGPWKVMCQYPSYRDLEYLAFTAPSEGAAYGFIEARMSKMRRKKDEREDVFAMLVKDTRSRYRVIYDAE